MKNLYYLVPPERKKNPELANEFQLKPVKQWVVSLPTANYGMTTRLFRDRIVLMNETELESEVLLNVLEELYPVYLTIEEFLLSRLFGKSCPLTTDEQKIAHLAESVTKDFLIGYGIVLRDVSVSTAGWRFARALPRVICRLMRGLSRVLILRYLLRLPDPEWLWLDLHGLYLLAEQKNKQNSKVRERKEGEAITIETLYKQILMLRLSDPWGLGHREILEIYERLEDWTESAELKVGDPPSDSSACIIDVDEDKPPSLKTDVASERDPDFRVYTLILDNLFRRLSELLNSTDHSIGRFDLVTVGGNRSGEEPATLLKYLHDRWSGVAACTHELFEDRKPRLLSIGLKATHQQLNPPTNPEEKMMSDWLVTVSENHSLRCEFDQPGQLFLGSLVSLKLVDLENARRILGVVDRIWMARIDGAVHFDIAVLSPQVLAAGIQPARGKKELQIYQRVLLFFTEKESGRKANLVLESQKLKNGNTVQLLSQEDSVKVLLENRHNVGPGYSHFECIPLAEDKKEEIPTKGYDFL